jgi:hypothetical protein
MSSSIQRALLITILTALTLVSIYLGIRLHKNSVADKKIKFDYFTVNQIKYGLLSGNNWSYQVNTILSQKIDSFSFDEQNKAVLAKQINALLERMLNEANAVLHKERKNLKDKLKYNLINAFIDVEDFKPEIPRFSHAIIDEISKSKNKNKMKEMLKSKISGILDVTNQDTIGEKFSVMERYGQREITAFNALIEIQTDRIREEQRQLGYMLIGVLVAVLLLWLWIFKIRKFYGLTFLYSVLISFSALFTGISLPMIEIDARISELNLELLGSHIIFYDQVIFYQAKSIIDVVRILITNGKADTVFVGVLIFIFSVLFPVLKLISTTIYLFRTKKANGFIRYMSFNSGKWSMADVMVIAIFMAYVGFKGILDNQLADITVATDTVNVLTTNRTNLQTGYIIFVAFCLYNLILAGILKKITAQKNIAGAVA